MDMRNTSGNLPHLLLVAVTIAGVCVSPLALFGHVTGQGAHKVCMSPDQRCGDAGRQAPKRCCPGQPESVSHCPVSPQDEQAPVDGQSGCHCCIVVSVSPPATFALSCDELPDSPSQLVRATIEAFVPFLWIDSLLRPPRA